MDRALRRDRRGRGGRGGGRSHRHAVAGLAASQWAAASGIAIHMALAVGIGVLFVSGLRAARSTISTALQLVAAGVALGTAIWAFNFLVLLPEINPGFVELVPPAVALTSKLLFGLGLACGPLVRWDRSNGFHGAR